MSNGSLDTLLMNAAWKRLWTPGTPYYLPDAMLNGVHQDGIVVTPYQTVEIESIGPVPLYDSDTWGHVSVTMTNSTVTGLPGVSNGGLGYDDAQKSFAAEINFGALDFSGSYEADGRGVAGCAMNAAKSLLGVSAAAVKERRLEDADADMEIGGGADDPSIALALQYRDQLAGQPLAGQPQTGSGMSLVSTYYDNNEALNEMVTGSVPGATVFNVMWPVVQTQGEDQNGHTVTVTSALLASQTTASASDPNNPDKPVGYPAYSLHAYTMQGLMLSALQAAYNGATDAVQKKKYNDAMTATLAFQNATSPMANTTTVSSVMNHVASTPPPTDDAAELAVANVAFPYQEQVERATRELIELHDKMSDEERAQRVRANALALGGASDAKVRGTFDDSITHASLTLYGIVTILGKMPNMTLTVTINSISAVIPRVKIHLSGSGEFLDDVSNYIAHTSWFQGLLASKIATDLNNPSLLSYLSERMNQALAKAFGGP